MLLFGALLLSMSCSEKIETPWPEPAMELYPSYKAVGLEIDFPAVAPADNRGVFEWRLTGEDEWRNGVDLTINEEGTKVWASIWPLEMDQPVEVRLHYTAAGKKLTLTGAARTRKILTEAAGGRAIHVSMSGDDEASGTAGEPLRTIAAASAKAGPGDEIIVGGGLYREGDLFAGLHGVPEKPVIIRAAMGEQAVLDGSLEIPAGDKRWRRAGDNLYSLEFKPPTGYAGYVAQDGLRMFWSKSLENIRQGEFMLNDRKTIERLGRSWFFDSESSTLYVRTGDASVPSDHAYNVAVYRHGALLDGSRHVVLQGMELRYYGESAVLLDNGASECAVLDNVIRNSQRAVVFEGEQTRDNAIWRNEIYERGLHDFTWQAIKSSQYGRQAIDGVAGRGNSFCYNKIHGYFDAIAPAQWGDWERLNLNRDLDLMYNEMYNIGDDGIEVEGGGINVRVHGNRMRNVFSAISLAPVLKGPTYVTRNEASYHILMFKLNVGGVVSDGHCYCYHNSGYSLTRGEPYGGIAINFPASGSIPISNKVFKNNIFICDNFGVRFADERSDLDWNCYWRVASGAGLVFRWAWQEQGDWSYTDYDNLTAFSSAGGMERNGIETDPKFRDPVGVGALERVMYDTAPFHVYPKYESAIAGDLRLSPDSPCIDRGVVIRGINDRMPYGKPDMGAFEFGEDQ